MSTLRERMNDIGQNTLGQCATCKHMIPFSLKCKAFPNGLPEAIRQGRWDHREPFEGDNGILYEPVDTNLTTAPPYAKNKIK